MKENSVCARFAPTNVGNAPTTCRPHRLLQDTPPKISAALLSLYPFLLLANRILAFITWTTKDERTCYRNVVLIILYALAVVHWNDYFTIVLPAILTLTLCSWVWLIKVLYIDHRYVTEDSGSDNEDLAPTLEEIVDTLDNFNMRCSFLLSFDHFTPGSLRPTFTNIMLLTPFYSYTMQHYIPVNIWISVISVYMLTYYSAWSIALRRLLWRSRYVRQMLSFITNEHYPLRDKELETTIMSLNIKRTIDDTTKIVEFHMLENERRWIGLGWSKQMLFFDRSPFCTPDMKQQLANTDQFQFPLMRNYKHSEWQWLDIEWKPLHKKHGWTYFDNRWKHPSAQDSVTCYTRSRILCRQCVVVLLKTSRSATDVGSNL
jgi:hypothetical protein